MTLEEKLQKMLDGEIVLHTPTQEIFDKLMDSIKDKTKPLKSRIWETHRYDTCVDNEYNGKSAKDLSYCYEGYYKRNSYTIVELTLEDFSTPPTTSDKQQELLQKVLEVTKDISAISKLEDKYKTDVDFGTLVEIRDGYLEQLEDTF